ncbi:MAG: hypothetical protein MI862_11210 [Desulfobacterales bacterium]|nr:hypothetical protein [Desulfobacterales bacterium]
MGILKHLINLSKVEGVMYHILVDKNGDTVIHNMTDYKKNAPMIARTWKGAYAIGKSRLKYVCFSRVKENDLFIFPVGNYLLGVIKHENIKADQLADNVLNFIDRLLNKQPE